MRCPLLLGRIRLLLRNPENLDPRQAANLDELLAVNQPLMIAYL